MAQVTKVVVKRQCKDQIWYEAIDLQEYNMRQTHEISKNTESSASSTSLSFEENAEHIRRSFSSMVYEGN